MQKRQTDTPKSWELGGLVFLLEKPQHPEAQRVYYTEMQDYCIQLNEG